MSVARPGRQYEQEARIGDGAHLVPLVRVEHGGEPGAARDRVTAVAHFHLSVDDDEIGAFVYLVLLERLARGQVDGDRPGLAGAKNGSREATWLTRGAPSVMVMRSGR